MSIVSEHPPHAEPAVTSDEALREVMQRLDQARQRIVKGRLVTSILAGVATMGLAAMLMAIVDYWWELPFSARVMWLTLIVLGSGFAGFKVVRRLGSYSTGSAAADVERRIEAFGQRLRTNHDYQNRSLSVAPASPSLLDALRDDTYGVGRQVNWDQAVDPRPRRRAATFAVLVAAVWIVSLALSPEFRTATGRALLLPLEYTNVTYDPQISTVRPGDSVEINVTVSGRPIDSAQLKHRPASSQDEWVILNLAPASAAVAGHSTKLTGQLATTLADLQNDVEFQVLAGPRRLPAGSIRVLQPLTVADRQARVIPPAYTGREEQTLPSLDIKVLEGSTVELRVVLNRPASNARLLLADSVANSDDKDNGPVPASKTAQSREIPLLIESNTIRGDLTDLRRGVSGVIMAKAADDMSLDPEPLEIRVQADRKPELQFMEPAEELVVTATTEVPIQAEAKDDIGLHKMGILFQIGDGPMHTLWEEDGKGSIDPKQMASVLMLEEQSLGYQDGVTYYAFAEDNYFGRPRRTTTPLRFIDIRPYKLAYQVLESGGT
jgi:hypothetical protein